MRKSVNCKVGQTLWETRRIVSSNIYVVVNMAVKERECLSFKKSKNKIIFN